MRSLLIVLAVSGLCGCSGAVNTFMRGGDTSMAEIDRPFTARRDEALIVFMKPSRMGDQVTAVYDITGEEAKFLGLVNAYEKIGYYVKPGEYRFMLDLDNDEADVMSATVAAGKTYYVCIAPAVLGGLLPMRVGSTTAFLPMSSVKRFYFQPVSGAQLDSKEFASWDAGTRFVTNSPASLAWAERNAAVAVRKRDLLWYQRYSPLRSPGLRAEDAR